MDTRSQRGQAIVEMIWFLIFIFGFFIMYLSWGQSAKHMISREQESKEAVWFKH